MNISVPQKAATLLNNWHTIGFPRRNVLHGISYLLSIQKFCSKNLSRKRRLGRRRHRKENNIKMDIRDIGYESVNWIKLA